MNNEKSNRPMSEKESLTYGCETLKECDEKLHQMVMQLRERDIVGPLSPALQHLEEASFLIRKCIVAQDEFLLKMKIEEAVAIGKGTFSIANGTAATIGKGDVTTTTRNTEGQVCVDLPNTEHLNTRIDED